jgi:hypothetical protein
VDQVSHGLTSILEAHREVACLLGDPPESERAVQPATWTRLLEISKKSTQRVLPHSEETVRSPRRGWSQPECGGIRSTSGPRAAALGRGRCAARCCGSSPPTVVAELKELATDALVAQRGLSFASRTTRSLISGECTHGPGCRNPRARRGGATSPTLLRSSRRCGDGRAGGRGTTRARPTTTRKAGCRRSRCRTTRTQARRHDSRPAEPLLP